MFRTGDVGWTDREKTDGQTAQITVYNVPAEHSPDI